MARTKDRYLISEAVRTQDLWRIKDLNDQHLVLITNYDEWLYVDYDRAGAVKSATYIHCAEDGTIASREDITRQKRARVLHLIGAHHRTHAQSPVL